MISSNFAGTRDTMNMKLRSTRSSLYSGSMKRLNEMEALHHSTVGKLLLDGSTIYTDYLKPISAIQPISGTAKSSANYMISRKILDSLFATLISRYSLERWE